MVEYIVENALVLVPVLNIIGMIIKNTEKSSYSNSYGWNSNCSGCCGGDSKRRIISKSV